MSIYQADSPSVAPHLAIANDAADEWQQHTPRANGADMDKVRYIHFIVFGLAFCLPFVFGIAFCLLFVF